MKSVNVSLPELLSTTMFRWEVLTILITVGISEQSGGGLRKHTCPCTIGLLIPHLTILGAITGDCVRKMLKTVKEIQIPRKRRTISRYKNILRFMLV